MYMLLQFRGPIKKTNQKTSTIVQTQDTCACEFDRKGHFDSRKLIYNKKSGTPHNLLR